MGNKDFSDWNGRKRKQQYSCPPVEPMRGFTMHKKDKPVGFKTRVDRYRSELADLRQYWEWYRRERRQVMKYRGSQEERDDRRRGLVPWAPRWRESISDRIVKLRKLEAQYKKEGLWDRVKQALAA